MRRLERRSEQWDRRQLITQSAAERRRSRVDVDLPIYASAPHENGSVSEREAKALPVPGGFALPDFLFGATSPTSAPSLSHQDSDPMDHHGNGQHGDNGRGSSANGVFPSPAGKTDPHIPNAPASNPSLQKRASANERVISTSTAGIRPALCIRILGIQYVEVRPHLRPNERASECASVARLFPSVELLLRHLCVTAAAYLLYVFPAPDESKLNLAHHRTHSALGPYRISNLGVRRGEWGGVACVTQVQSVPRGLRKAHRNAPVARCVLRVLRWKMKGKGGLKEG
jgi:hypothetical protein